MQHPDEGTIHAWLDGALSDEEAAAIELHVSECEECASSVAEARGLIAASSRIVSALDVVPRGVIPAAKPRRAVWYTNTQLRAAAAVIIVAGASLLLVRTGREEAVMQPSHPMIAAARETTPPTSVETPAEADKAVAQTSAPAAPKAKKVASTAATGARRENSQKKAVVDEVASTAPAPAPSPSRESDLRADAARAAEPQRALLGKVSGTAMSAVLSELRRVRADTTQSAQRTIYEVSPGVEVTLLEWTGPMPAAAAVLSATTAQEKVAQKTAAPPAANAPRKAAVNSISWTSKAGHAMTLTGVLSKEELQELRFRLPADKQ
jgi:hypothetical protein